MVISNKQMVLLNSMDKIKEFARTVYCFEEDVNIYGKSLQYDAKSLMALYAIDTSEPTMVEIVTNDEAVIVKFSEMMKDFAPEE